MQAKNVGRGVSGRQGYKFNRCAGGTPCGPGDVVTRGCCPDLGLTGQLPLAEIPPKSGSLVPPSGSPQP